MHDGTAATYVLHASEVHVWEAVEFGLYRREPLDPLRDESVARDALCALLQPDLERVEWECVGRAPVVDDFQRLVHFLGGCARTRQHGPGRVYLAARVGGNNPVSHRVEPISCATHGAGNARLLFRLLVR